MDDKLGSGFFEEGTLDEALATGKEPPILEELTATDFWFPTDLKN